MILKIIKISNQYFAENNIKHHLRLQAIKGVPILTDHSFPVHHKITEESVPIDKYSFSIWTNPTKTEYFQLEDQDRKVQI